MADEYSVIAGDKKEYIDQEAGYVFNYTGYFIRKSDDDAPVIFINEMAKIEIYGMKKTLGLNVLENKNQNSYIKLGPYETEIIEGMLMSPKEGIYKYYMSLVIERSHKQGITIMIYAVEPIDKEDVISRVRWL